VSTENSGMNNINDWVEGWLTLNRMNGDLWKAFLEKDATKSSEIILSILTEGKLLLNRIKLIQESDHAKNVFR